MTLVLSPNSKLPLVVDGYPALSDTQNYDLRQFTRLATAPIAVVREWAEVTGLGAYTRLWGEAVERRLAASAYFYWVNRDRKASVDHLVADLGVHYVADFTLTAGERTDISICFSRILSPGLSPLDIVEELTRIVTWLLPHYRNHLAVNVCHTAESDIVINHAAKAIVRGIIRR